MSISMNSLRGGKLQIKAARVILGMRGHRPSSFNIKVGKCMKEGAYKPTDGGRHDTNFQGKFITCAVKAGANVGAAGRAKAT